MLDHHAADERLFVITPDAAEPGVIEQLADPRMLWFNFAGLSQAIDQLLTDPMQLVADQERFLLRELQALFEQEGLVTRDDVDVVAARHAYGEYLSMRRTFASLVDHFEVTSSEWASTGRVRSKSIYRGLCIGVSRSTFSLDTAASLRAHRRRT